MEYFIIISVVAFIGGLILHAITSSAVRAPGNVLKSKFASLGTIKGKSFDDIQIIVGAPNAVSTQTDADGNIITVRQWIATSYHVVLLFDENDICLGISSETSV